MRVFQVLLVTLTLLFPSAPLNTTAQEQAAGVQPVSIEIPKANIQAQVEPAQIVSGVPEEPKCPWVVYWYEPMSLVGVPGNVVMVGANDWWEVGPAVFHSLDTLRVDDEIEVIGADGKLYRYQIVTVTNYDRASAPLQDIFATPDEEHILTLLTDAEPWNEAAQSYEGVLVVTASQTVGAVAPDATPEATSISKQVDATTDPNCRVG